MRESKNISADPMIGQEQVRGQPMATFELALIVDIVLRPVKITALFLRKKLLHIAQ